MKVALTSVSGLLLAMFGGSVLAADFPVWGESARGRPGETVTVGLTYKYDNYDGTGTSFGAIVEDFQFEYQFAGITLVLEQSNNDMFAAAQNLFQYAETLGAAARALGGNVTVNPIVVGPRADYKGYALSFFTDGRPQARSGDVHLDLAFFIPLNALPGWYEVSFTDKNVLADEAGNEFSYPVAMQHLGVAVVPELPVAWMLMAGLPLAALYARRRGHRSD